MSSAPQNFHEPFGAALVKLLAQDLDPVVLAPWQEDSGLATCDLRSRGVSGADRDLRESQIADRKSLAVGVQFNGAFSGHVFFFLDAPTASALLAGIYGAEFVDFEATEAVDALLSFGQGLISLSLEDAFGGAVAAVPPTLYRGRVRVGASAPSAIYTTTLNLPPGSVRVTAAYQRP